MGRFLAREGPLPTRVLCSTAARAQETWARARPGIEAAGAAPALTLDRGLYLAGSETMLERLQACGAEPCLLLVVHQPGIQDLARRLAGSGDEEAWERMRARYPTGALTTLSFAAARWEDLAPAGGKLLRFVVPREIGESGRPG